MNDFDYKKYLAEGKLTKEDELPVDDIKKAIKALLKKEGGAAGLSPILKLAKDFEGVTQIDVEDILDNDMKDVKKHRDGDYILKEDMENSLIDKWESLSDEDRETALLSAIEDPDNAQEYIDFRYEDLPSEVTSNMIFEDEDGGDIISVAKSILKDQPMDINNYLNSLRNDIRLNGSEGYIEFGDDDWVEDYEEYMADRARA